MDEQQPGRRHSIRLKNYDYAREGAYFVTICTADRKATLTGPAYRAIIEQTWTDLPNHYPNVQVDEFVVMPNHVHGIIVLTSEGNGWAGLRPAPTDEIASTQPAKEYPLSEIVRAFKSFSARRINEVRQTPGIPFWQRNYYEHIIRNDIDLYEIREYIVNNPASWELDEQNPERRRDSR
jgi:putative transposase